MIHMQNEILNNSGSWQSGLMQLPTKQSVLIDPKVQILHFPPYAAIVQR